jgi:putative membrane protein
MTILRLARTELSRLTAGKLPKLAVAALVLVPLLYGCLYLYANSDPYKKLDHIPAALVMQDSGATATDGTRLDAGRKVADKLKSSGAFEWHEVSAAGAESGVRDGKYTFSLTLPKDFSATLLSSGEFEPRQGQITVTTNDANNYLVGTIADRVVGEVRNSVATEVSTDAADKFLVGFGTIYGKTQEAANGATELADGAGQARDGTNQLAAGQNKLLNGAQQLETGTATAAQGASTLSGGLNTLQDKTKSLPAQTKKLADGAKQVADGNEKVAQKGELVAGAAQGFVNDLDQLESDIAERLRADGMPEAQVQQVIADLRTLRGPIDTANGKVQGVAGQLRTLATGAHQVSDGAHRLAAATPALTSGIGQAADGGRQLASGTQQLHGGATQLRQGEQTAVNGTNQLASGTNQLADGAAKLRDGLTSGLDQIPHPDKDTRDATAKTIGDPVAIHTVGQANAGSYGAGLAPFFLSLALWIGAFVLFLLVRPLSNRALAARQPAWRTAIAGWLPAATLGVAQVVVLYAAVTLLVGIHPAHPVATLAFLMLTSLAFVAIVHALNALFGAVGKFLGLVILILQLISAGGTFPWQTLPDPLYPLHAALPMGYVVDGLRHLLYGGTLSGLWVNILVLAGYLAGGLAVATFAAHRRRVWTVSQLKPELVL